MGPLLTLAAQRGFPPQIACFGVERRLGPTGLLGIRKAPLSRLTGEFEHGEGDAF